jgi:murein DD-endopeptidase MepM/ murein hydrolase activator NlpD
VTFPSRALRSRSTTPKALQGLLVAALITVLLALMAAPAPAATEKELLKARNERAAVQAELDRTAAAYDAAQAKLAETQTSIAAGHESLKVAEVKELQAQVRLSARANIMYRRGPVAIFQFLVGADSLNDFGVRMKLIEGAAKQDSTTIAEAAKTRSETTALQQQLLADEQQQKTLLSNMSVQTKSLTSNFTKAQELEAKLASDRAAALKAEQEKAAKAAASAKAKTEAAKKTAAAAVLAVPTPTAVTKALASPSPATVKLAAGPAVPVGTKGFCPVNGPVSFTDTYGAPRSGGRRHQGVDMFAAMRTPAAAIVDGVLLRRETSSLGGMSVYLKGNNGNEYFYTHLVGYSDVAPGQKVSAGQTIGYVGDSGNASGGPPHLHFEIREGGVPINPTPTVRLACGK